MLIRESIPDATPVGDGGDEPAPAETRELVRHDLAGYAQGLSEIGRVRRRVPKGKQDAGAGLVRQGVPEARERGRVGQGHGCCHDSDDTGNRESREC